MYGKTLKFCSHGTGGLAQVVDIITEALPDSTISENVFDCYEQDASSSQQDIESWLSELGILKTFVKIKKTFERIASLVHDNSARDAIFNALAA